MKGTDINTAKFKLKCGKYYGIFVRVPQDPGEALEKDLLNRMSFGFPFEGGSAFEWQKQDKKQYK